MKRYNLTRKENLYIENGISSKSIILHCVIRSKSIKDDRLGILKITITH